MRLSSPVLWKTLTAFGLEFPTDMRLAYELAPCQDCDMDGQICWDKRKNKSKNKSKRFWVR
jgi:hypothetical protein